MIGTLTFATALAAAGGLYLWWEHSDRQKERAALRTVRDLAGLGDVTAASLSPRIDPDRCLGSGACVSACPEHGVIALVGGRAQLVNPLGCIGHGACASACPVTAIQLVYGTKTRGVELPILDANFQTNRAGVYIAGELGGMGLIQNAVKQGRYAADHIIGGATPQGAALRRGRNGALDALVVGAGPAGISATLRLLEAGLSVRLLDREALGGTILHYPRAKLVMTGNLELPLYGKVKGTELSKEQLVETWRDVQAKIALPLVTGELVTELRAEPDTMWSVVSERGVHRAANVILALGRRGSPERLGVPGEDQAKVAYRLLEPSEFAGRHVLVIGGGNSAIESALALLDAGTCASITISYRRSEFARCRAENRRRIDAARAEGGVRVCFESEVREIRERDVVLRDARGQNVVLLNDSVIIQIGGVRPAELLRSLGIELTTKYGER